MSTQLIIPSIMVVVLGLQLFAAIASSREHHIGKKEEWNDIAITSGLINLVLFAIYWVLRFGGAW